MQEILENKYVKIGVKILVAFGGLIILLLVATGLYVHFNKDKIIAEVKAAVSKLTSGEVQITDIDFSLFSNFPNTGVKISGVSILDSQYHQPLFHAEEVTTGISIFQLLKSNKTIGRLTINNAAIHLFTDSTGYSNTYILSVKDTVTKKKPSLILKRIELNNVNVLVEDALKEKKYEFIVSDLKAAINVHDSLWDISMDERIFVKGLGFNLPKGSFLVNQTVAANNWKMQLNTFDNDLKFSKSNVEIDHHKYLLTGKFHFADSAFFQLHAQTQNIPLMMAEKLLTKNIQEKIKLVDLKLPITVEADLQGPLTKRGDPYITAVINVKANEIETTVTAFTNCSFTGVFNNHISDTLPPSDENTQLIFTSFSANWNGVALKTDSILIHNLSEPTINFSFLTHTSLKELDSSLALNTVRLENGTADIAINYNGPLIADPSLLSKLNVEFSLKNGTMVYEPRSLAFSNCSGEIDISENSIAINKIVCDVAGNHFEVNAIGQNLTGLAIADSGKAFLAVEATSPFLNLTDFISLFSEKKIGISRVKKKGGLAVTAAKIDELLQKGTIQLNIKIGQVTNHQFVAENVNASLQFAKDNWQVLHASLKHAGGELLLKAGISEIRNNYHQVIANLKLTNVDVSKVFYAFNNFGMEGISSKNISGLLNTNASLAMGLSNRGGILPGSIEGAVDFSIKKGALINYKPILQIQNYILQDRDLSNIIFAELKNKLTIQNDEVHINRMEIASTAIRFFVQGVYGITGKTDISIQVPFSNFVKKKEGAAIQTKGLLSKPGPSIFLRAKSGITGKVKIGLDLPRKNEINKFKNKE